MTGALLRKQQFSKRKPCYYCGAAPPSTKEHAPPVMMLAGFDTDSITVPACDTHNTAKSIGDRAVVTAAILGAVATKRDHPASDLLTHNVLKAIDLHTPHFHEAAQHVSLRRLGPTTPPRFDVPLPHVSPDIYLARWMRHLSAAMAWNVLGSAASSVKWDGAWSWSPLFVPTNGPIEFSKVEEILVRASIIEQDLLALKWFSGWSARPRSYPADIYSLSVAFLSDPQSWGGNDVVFLHRLYNGCVKWYVLFPLPPEEMAIVREAVEETIESKAG